MKIAELLNESELPGKKAGNPFTSNLPSAPSLDDEPDEVDDELDGEEEDLDDEDEYKEGIEKFKKYAGNMGNDLYSIVASDKPQKTLGHVHSIAKDLPTLSKSVIKHLENFIEEHDSSDVFAIILNARNGDIYEFIGGGGSRLDNADGSDEIAVEDDQLAVLNKLNTSAKMLDKAIDTGKDISVRHQKVMNVLGTHTQPKHYEPWQYSGLFRNKEEYDADEEESRKRRASMWDDEE
jgi:hypothetical protein